MAEIQGQFGERLAKVETEVSNMKHDLFGNGQPGILATLGTKLDEVKADNRRLAYIITVIMTAMLFAAGSGTLSLKSLLELFK